MPESVDDQNQGTSQQSPVEPKKPLKKVFNDPIHGTILLHEVLVKIIDTPQFQRLRNIKQLGAQYFVYPGASHNRFEHCIGTAYLAGELARLLDRNQPELGIDDKDVLCVEIAGLCHDLGHGPYSHVFDGMFMPRVQGKGKKWTHEKGSCDMLDHLISENRLSPILKKFSLEDDLPFVKQMIKGEKPNFEDGSYKDEKKSFLYEIISNERNKVDVDKWDYFARDCHHLGLKNSFDHKRFMQFMRVLKVDGRRQICVRDSECLNLYEMFHVRSSLHRRAYQHRVGKVIELMICDAMVEADSLDSIKNKFGCKLSVCAYDQSAFTKLDDGIFETILHSTDEEEEAKKAREILGRILKRDLYYYMGTIDLTEIPLTVHNVPEGLVTDIASNDEGLLEEDLAINQVTFSYGMGKKNPVDHFWFYSKSFDDNSEKPHRISKEAVSHMLPKVFEEKKIQVFCKTKEKDGIAKRCFKTFIEREKEEERRKKIRERRRTV